MFFIDVIDSTSTKRFNDMVKRKPTLVQFFSPQCGYCKELEPEWSILVNNLKNKYKGDIMLARIRNDMIKNVKCHKKIEGFPTIFVLDKGRKVKEYMGKRRSADLLKFIGDNFSITMNQRGGRRKRRKRRKRKRVSRRSRHKRKQNTKKRRRYSKNYRHTFRRRIG